jgi:hypothetical protein
MQNGDATGDLSGRPSDETIKVSEELTGSPSEPLPGFVAVLDALGASTYSKDELEQFLQARNQIVDLVAKLAEEQIKINPKHLRRFVFNDTIILAYVRGVTYQAAWDFCHILRVVEAFFLERQIFFRGAIGVGDFYKVDERINTVMGPAVSDAAAWYDRADWIGIHTTPYATIFLRSLLEKERKNIDCVLVDYDIPLKDKGRMKLKAINWPKRVYLDQGKSVEQARAKMLSLLAKAPMPVGSESKYFHAIEFFNYCDEHSLLAKQT